MTDLNKTLRVRFEDEGADGVKKNIKEVGTAGDDLSKKKFTPKIDVQGGPEAQKLTLKITEDMKKLGGMTARPKIDPSGAAEFNRVMDGTSTKFRRFGDQTARPKVDLGGIKQIDVQMAKVMGQLKVFSERAYSAQIAVRGDEKATLQVDKLMARMEKLSGDVAKPRVKMEGIDKALLEMRAANLEMKKFGPTADEASTHADSSFKRFLGTIGGDAMENAFKKISGFFSGDGGGIVSMEKGGDSAANAFTGAFGQQLKVVGIGALVAWLATLAPALVPFAVGLGVGIGGAVIAGMTHADLKKKFTDTFHGILADLGKDTTPMVKPLEQMLSQVGRFVKSLGPGLTNMFKASLPFVKGFVTIMEQFGKEAIPVLTESMKEFRPYIPMMVAGFKSLLQGLLGFIKVLGPGMKPAAELFRISMSMIKAALYAVGAICDGLAITFDLMVGVFTGKSKMLTSIANGIKRTWSSLSSAAKKYFGDIEKFFENVWGHIWSWGSQQVTRFAHDAEHGWNDVFSFCKQVFGKIESFFKNLWHSMWTWAVTQVKNFATSVTQAWNNVFSDAKNIFGKIESSIKSIWNSTWTWVKNTLHQAGQDIHNLWNDIFSDAKNIFGKIESSVKNIWSDLWNWAKTTLRNIGHDIHVLWSDMLSDAKDMFGKIETGVKNIWSDLWNWAKTTLRNIGHDIHVLWNDMLSDAADIFDKIRSKVKDIWNDVWNWCKSRLHQAGADIHTLWNDILADAGHIFGAVESTIKRIWGNIWTWVKRTASDAVKSVTSILGGLANIWNGIANAVGLKKLDIKVGQGHQNGGLMGYASGGQVPGQGRGDRKLAMVESGEAIVPVRNVAKYAQDFKRDGIPGFQRGGIIGSAGIPQFTNGGTADGKPSGGGDPKVTHTTGKAGETGGKTPAQLRGKSLAGDGFDVGKILKNIKNDAIQAAFKPVTNVVNGATKALIAEGGFGELMGEAAQTLVSGILNKLESAATQAESSASGSEIATYAKKFKGHRYVLGGPGDYQTNHNAPFGAWDCAGFVSQMYDHFGLGSPTAGINVTALRNWSKNKKDKKPTVGGMAFFVGSDGSPSHPGHVGLVTGNNEMINAEDPAAGTRMASLNGALWYATPPGGFGGNGKFSGKGGTAVYSYLLNNLFAGHKIAAAGATASIWGESAWNPEAQGTGGRGLIGWTPPSKLPNRAFTGNATKDMAAQLPLIKAFVEDNPPDPERVRAMYGAKSVAQAAEEWGKGIERYGIDDVHSQGVSLATQIMNSYGNGGSNKKGMAEPGQKKTSLANSKHLALGGWLNEPVFGMGLRTGAAYSMAENAPEYVTPMGNMTGQSAGGGGVTVINNVIHAPSGDGKAIGQTIVSFISEYERKTGKRGDNAVFNK